MPSETAHTDTVRPLLYRPTFKLTKTDEGPILGFGWKSQTFRDERGNIYERDRDGEWERWSLIERRVTPRGKVLFKADLKKAEPEDHGDCLDRIDDLKFGAMALSGLIEDARKRGLFSDGQLNRMQETVMRLFEQAAGLEPAIVEPVRNGHA